MTAASELAEAVAEEGLAYRALLDGEPAQGHLIAARDAYLRSHAQVRAESWGRLLGALKMAILAGDGVAAVADAAIAQTGDAATPVAAYLRALGRVALGQTPQTGVLVGQGGAFALAGSALAALARGDRAAYAAAATALLEEFERRDEFVTGVRFADTVAVLQCLAGAHGIAARLASDILPPPEGL